MPRYEYWCSQCEEGMTLIHSYKDIVTVCPQCSSENEFKRIISDIKVNYSVDKKGKTGSIVKDFIKQTKDDITSQKKKLSKRQKP